MRRNFAFLTALPLPRRVIGMTDYRPDADADYAKRAIIPSPAWGLRRLFAGTFWLLGLLGVVLAIVIYSVDAYLYALSALGIAVLGGIGHWCSRRYNLARPDRFITLCREDGHITYEDGLFRKRTRRFRFSESEGFLRDAQYQSRLYVLHPEAGKCVLDELMPATSLLSTWAFIVQYMDPEAPLPFIVGLTPERKDEPPYPRFTYREWEERWQAVPEAAYRTARRDGVDSALEPGTLEWRRDL